MSRENISRVNVIITEGNRQKKKQINTNESHLNERQKENEENSWKENDKIDTLLIVWPSD